MLHWTPKLSLLLHPNHLPQVCTWVGEHQLSSTALPLGGRTPIVLNRAAVRWKYPNRHPLHYRWVGEPQSSSTLTCCCWMGEPKLIELSSTVPGSPIQIVFHCAATGGRTPVIFQDAPLYRPGGLAMHTTKICVSLGLACLHPGGVVG